MTTSYPKMLGSNAYKIQFWLILYLLLILYHNPFKNVCREFLCYSRKGEILSTKNLDGGGTDAETYEPLNSDNDLGFGMPPPRRQPRLLDEETPVFSSKLKPARKPRLPAKSIQRNKSLEHKKSRSPVKPYSMNTSPANPSHRNKSTVYPRGRSPLKPHNVIPSQPGSRSPIKALSRSPVKAQSMSPIKPRSKINPRSKPLSKATSKNKPKPIDSSVLEDTTGSIVVNESTQKTENTDKRVEETTLASKSSRYRDWLNFLIFTR